MYLRNSRNWPHLVSLLPGLLLCNLWPVVIGIAVVGDRTFLCARRSECQGENIKERQEQEGVLYEWQGVVIGEESGVVVKAHCTWGA